MTKEKEHVVAVIWVAFAAWLLTRLAVSGTALAQSGEPPTEHLQRCIEAPEWSSLVARGHGVIEPLNASQWPFLRGISFVLPSTPMGLPLGDGAVLGQNKRRDGA